MNIKKRRRDKYNPYKLSTYEGKYMVTFNNNSIFVSEEIFNLMNKFELEDISQMHKYERHIEHSNLCEETLYYRTIKKELPIIDEVIKKEQIEKLYYVISKLPEIQKRRLELYYFKEKTLKQIALEENCSIHSVFISIERAKEKIKKNLSI